MELKTSIFLVCAFCVVSLALGMPSRAHGMHQSHRHHSSHHVHHHAQPQHKNYNNNDSSSSNDNSNNIERLGGMGIPPPVKMRAKSWRHSSQEDDDYDDDDGGRHAYLMTTNKKEQEHEDEDDVINSAFEKHMKTHHHHHDSHNRPEVTTSSGIPKPVEQLPEHDVYAYQLPSNLWFIVRYAKDSDGHIEKYMNIVASFTNYLDKLVEGVRTVSVNVKGVETVFRLTAKHKPYEPHGSPSSES